MKRVFYALLFVFLSLTPCWGASLTGVPGVAGLQLGTVPAPGYYSFDSYFSYSSKDFYDRHGDHVSVFMDKPFKFDVELKAGLTTFLWVSPYKILGANYAASVTEAVGNAKGDIDLGETAGVAGAKTGMLDLSVQPIGLSWHFRRFDFAMDYGFVAPTGTFDPHDAVNTGRDRWSHVFKTGMTAYLDEKKSWTIALAPRYNFYMGQQHKDAHDGGDVAIGWGIGKEWKFMNKEQTAPTGIFTTGPVGYGLFQTTYNTGSQAIQKDVLPKVYSAGLEAKYTRVKWKGATLDVRVTKEFEAAGRPQGMATTVSFAFKF